MVQCSDGEAISEPDVSFRLAAASDLAGIVALLAEDILAKERLADSPRVTPGIEAGLLHLTGSEAPILMFHYETDVASAPGR